MRVAIGTDHGGFSLKSEIVDEVQKLGHQVIDKGTNSADPVDYPDYAEAVGLSVANGEAERGVILCGSGVGASIAACKIKGVRAAVCHDTYSAHQGVEHDDMNVLTIGARIVGSELARELVRAFLGAEFSGDDRHVRRLSKVLAIEARFSGVKEDRDGNKAGAAL